MQYNKNNPNLSSFLLWRMWKLTAGINSLKDILILRESTVSISLRTILMEAKYTVLRNQIDRTWTQQKIEPIPVLFHITKIYFQ